MTHSRKRIFFFIDFHIIYDLFNDIFRPSECTFNFLYIFYFLSCLVLVISTDLKPWTIHFLYIMVFGYFFVIGYIFKLLFLFYFTRMSRFSMINISPFRIISSMIDYVYINLCGEVIWIHCMCGYKHNYL